MSPNAFCFCSLLIVTHIIVGGGMFLDSVNHQLSGYPATTADDALITTEGCGTVKGCMHYPEGCQLPGNCEAVLTWRPSTNQSDFVDFEMMAVTSGYVAVGLSNDEKMGDDSVIQCTYNSTNATVDVGLSYNPRSSVNNLVAPNTTIVRLTSWMYTNGILHCMFQRSIAGEDDRNIFPLDSPYILFLAKGSINPSGMLGYHGNTKYISPREVNVTSDLDDLTPGTATTITVPQPNSTVPQTTTPSDGGCGVTVGCFVDSVGNVVRYIMTADGMDIKFELSCQTSGWCAIGFSDTPNMELSSVIECIRHPAGSPVTVQHSYNNGGYSNVAVIDDTMSITDISTSYSDGSLNCTFLRRIVVTGNDRIFSLNSSYYLLLAKGPVDSAGGKMAHDIRPTVSSDKVDVRDIVMMGNATTNISSTVSVPQITTPSDSSCGVTVGCFYDSVGNVVRYAMTADGTDIKFDVTCRTSGWCAIGFSDTPNMAYTSVIECTRHPTGNPITVQYSYNPGYTNELVTDNTQSITDVSTSYSDGTLRCTFFRRIVVTGNDRIFSLNSPYYLLLAKGPVNSAGGKMAHDIRPTVSSDKVDVREIALISPANGRCNKCLLRAHGCLMITAWVLLASAGIILARYFKTAWPGDKICDTAVWFACHRFIMVLTLFCSISGFIIIFVYNDGRYSAFPESSSSYFWLHAPIGITVNILVIINPVMALGRCHPESLYRPIYNWLHWLVGTTCHVLAILGVFIGVKITELTTSEDKRISEPAVFWLMIGFVVFHTVIEVVLTSQKLAVDIISKRNASKKYEAENSPAEGSKDEPPFLLSLKLRYTILVIYGAGLIGVWIAMIVFIGS